MTADRALEFLMSRGFAITYGVVMCAAFAAVAFFTEIGHDAQLVWVFGSGVHAGIAFMWVISPRITGNWRRKMTAEIEVMMNEAFARAMNDAEKRALQVWSPTIVPPDEPRHRLQ